MSASKVILIFLGVVVLIGLGIGGCAFSGYKATIRYDEEVQQSWADVEVVLKRRFDLIPNIVETVKGYAKHETELLQGIADVRKSYFGADTRAEKAKAAGALEGMLSRLLVLRESYPDLKANQNFRALQIELEGTENRIAEKRKRYNAAVKMLNSHIRVFPGTMYASWTGVQKAEYFEAGEAAQETPKVKF
ncbi:MAG: LemA family protein [Planctomycetota bacterium]